MYVSRGFSPGENGDFDLIVHEDRLHLFHLCLPNHDVVAHLVSDDGITWQPMPHALHVGDPGSFDDDQIWTMHTFRWQGRFYMLYTALKQSEQGLIQRTGLATSDDLVRWEKSPNNPIAQAEPRWYETGAQDTGREDWRDPFAWVEDGVIHALVCAHEKDGPYNRRGCVGYMTSTDAVHWEVKPPFYSPGTNSDFEVPTVMKLQGRYYLLGHLCAPVVDVYRIANKLEGPWRRPPNDRLLPEGNMVFCPVTWRGRTLLYNCIDAKFDWPAQRRIVGPTITTRVISPPKEAVVCGGDGQLALRSFDPAWDAVSDGEIAVKLSEALAGVYRGDWAVDGPNLLAHCEPGMGVACWPVELADSLFEITLTPRGACELGMVWRSDDIADESTRAVLIPATQRIELQRVTLNTPGDPARLGRGQVTLQSNHCPFVDLQPARLRVVAYGPYVEVSVGDRVVLSYVTMSKRSGRTGLFVSDGAATFAQPRLRRLKAPLF